MALPSACKLVPVVCLSALSVLGAQLRCATERGAYAASPQDTAFSLFRQSEVRFRAGDFKGAAELLKKAHALYPQPTMLYNLGRALEGAGDPEGAIDAYTQYLADEKTLIDRGAIERQIATLRAQVAERERLQAERLEAQRAQHEAEERLAATRQAPVVTPMSPARVAAPWIFAGIGVLALATGGALGGVAVDHHDEANDTAGQLAATKLQSSAKSYALGANVGFGIGGAVAVAGVIWGLVDVRHRRVERTR